MQVALTPNDIQNMDVGTIDDILCSIPGYLFLGQQQQGIYYHAFMNALEGVDVNPFYLLMINAGIERWRGENTTMIQITEFVTPETIIELYKKLKEWNAKYGTLLQQQLAAKEALEYGKAAMAQEDGFEWGKNETAREAQARAVLPELYNQLSQIDLDIAALESDKKALDIDIKQAWALIALFSTHPLDAPARFIGE